MLSREPQRLPNITTNEHGDISLKSNKLSTTSLQAPTKSEGAAFLARGQMGRIQDLKHHGAASIPKQGTKLGSS
jgi:hypothetical protein